jgi:hypothetical protein
VVAIAAHIHVAEHARTRALALGTLLCVTYGSAADAHDARVFPASSDILPFMAFAFFVHVVSFRLLFLGALNAPRYPRQL